jgi:putative nucleotidyltransferase with HDIG domain
MAALDVGDRFLTSPRVHAENALDVLFDRLQTDQPDTYNHALAVESLSSHVAERASFYESLPGALRLGALLHDIGKLEVPVGILRKPGSLTRCEWATMQRHPAIGVRLLSSIITSAEVLSIVFSHHERWDGSGYPRGLVGRQIPLPARIVSVADAFNAMIERRLYRSPFTLEEALFELRANAGGQFDPVCVEAVCESIAAGADWRDG